MGKSKAGSKDKKRRMAASGRVEDDEVGPLNSQLSQLLHSHTLNVATPPIRCACNLVMSQASCMFHFSNQDIYPRSELRKSTPQRLMTLSWLLLLFCAQKPQPHLLGPSYQANRTRLTHRAMRYLFTSIQSKPSMCPLPTRERLRTIGPSQALELTSRPTFSHRLTGIGCFLLRWWPKITPVIFFPSPSFKPSINIPMLSIILSP